MQIVQARTISLFAAIVLAIAVAQPAAADEVTAMGTVLRGKIVKLSGSGVELAPAYGDGGLKIKWKDVSDIRTEKPFQVMYDDADAVYSPINGIRDGKLLVNGGEIATAEIYSGLPLNGAEPSLMDRMRNSWRYWDGTFDVAVNVTQATVNTTGVMVGFTTQRVKAPTRFVAAASYRFSRQENVTREVVEIDPGPPPVTDIKKKRETRTLEDEWKGLLRFEYDLTPRLYLFTAVDGEYDGIEKLSLRTVPKLGVGYEIWHEDIDDAKKNFLRAEAGGAYVYEKYFGGRHSQYFSIALGALAQYHLPFGFFEWRFDYLPAVDDWANDYLIRTQASFIIPVFDPLSVRATIADDFDNTPSDDAEKNSLYFMLGFSLAW